MEILIIKLAAMGDVLRTKSLLPGLKKAYPTSTITWLTNPGSAEIVRDPLVDRVLEFSLQSILELEAKEFQILLCLDKEPHALGLSKRLQATKKMGFAPTPSGTVSVWNEAATYALRLGLSDKLKYRINTKTHPEILFDLAELTYAGEDYGLTVDPPSRERVDQLFQRSGLIDSPLVGINTGCGEAFQTKAWTKEGFQGTIHQLMKTTDANVLLLGGPREAELNMELAKEMKALYPNRFFCTGTDNSLADFFAWVERCDVVLSSDSLAMHVAIALKKRVVVFFGPTCEQEIDLFGRGEKWVTDYACSPCYLKTCTVRPSCMQALSAEPIVEAISRQLSLAPAKARP